MIILIILVLRVWGKKLGFSVGIYGVYEDCLWIEHWKIEGQDK